jgi:transcriptional regulator with XRE-family HTH domain
MDSSKNYTERLRIAMEAKNITQGDVAKELNISQSMVSQYVSGSKKIPETTMLKLARLLGVDRKWLESGTSLPPEFLLKDIRSKTEWVYRKQHPDGGKEYGNAGIWTIPWTLDTLVREVVQNILDARRIDQQLPEVAEVKFSLIELEGEDLNRFLRALGWDGPDGLQEHIKASAIGNHKLGLDLTSGMAHLEKTKKIVLLKIEDSGTIGLTGKEYEDGNYTALVRDLLNTQKAALSAGGAYGLGKAVLWRASRFSTVIFNSTPKEPVEGKYKMRLIGKTDLPHHTISDIGFAGPGWYGYGDRRNKDEIVAATSVRDSSILADELHIHREDNFFGTSILVVGFHDPSSDENDDLLHTSNKIQEAVAKNFWPALLSGTLKASVSTWKGRKILADLPTDPEKYEPEYTEMYQKYRARDFSEKLDEPGNVIEKRVNLKLPRRTANPKHPRVEHEAVLLIRRDPTDAERPANELSYFRSPGMIVNKWKISVPSLGGHPFRAVLIAGEAADTATDASNAEMFLRAAEPPAHDNWLLTPGVKNSYAQGGGKSLYDFFNSSKNIIINEIKTKFDDDNDTGPRMLAELLILSDPDIPKISKPEIGSADYKIESDSSLKIKATIKLPNTNGWKITPTLMFAADSGRGKKVKWQLEAVAGCKIESGDLHIPTGRSNATFIGRTDPENHPSSSKETAVDIVLSKIATI